MTTTLRPMERLAGLRGPAHGTLLFGVFDGARDARIAALCAEGAEQACLYRGEVDPRLQAVAPWLVGAPEGDDVLLELVDAGFGKSWGFVGECRGGLDVAMRHWRGLLKVRLGGDEVLFRFYDPRVLRSYLPSLDAEGARAFFGPFRRLFLEDADQASWLSVTVGVQGVELVRHSPPAAGQEGT
jgi:hypothetical protein